MEKKHLKIIKNAVAGTDAKEDVKVMIFPQEGGIDIQIHSKLKTLFGEHMKQIAGELLEQYGVENCRMELYDQSALDYVLKARVETAILRGAAEGEA